MAERYFLAMIKHLRQHEEVMLYAHILSFDDAESEEVVSFLEQQYKAEVLSYPYTEPAFDNVSALWAAKTVYVAAQLMLYREHKPDDLQSLLHVFEGEITAGAILSVDLCLRFLPDIIFNLKAIDSQDALIELLEGILTKWHYSGIAYMTEIEEPEMEAVVSDPCMHQLYVNRIIEYKKMKHALLPGCRSLIAANLGDLGHVYWNEFKLATTPDE